MAPLYTMFRSSRSQYTLSLTTIDRSSHNYASLNKNKKTTYKQEEEDEEKIKPGQIQFRAFQIYKLHILQQIYRRRAIDDIYTFFDMSLGHLQSCLLAAELFKKKTYIYINNNEELLDDCQTLLSVIFLLRSLNRFCNIAYVIAPCCSRKCDPPLPISRLFQLSRPALSKSKC